VLLWSRASGGLGDEVAQDLAMVGDDAVLAVSYDKVLGFGGELAVLTGGPSAALVRFDPSGKDTWQKPLGTVESARVRVAPSGDGGVYVAGGVVGVLQPGQGLAPKGKQDIFLSRLDADGKPVWSPRWGTAEDEVATALAFAGDGVWLAGYYVAPLSFGGAPLVEFLGLPLGFLVRVDASGKVTTALKYTDLVLNEPRALAPAPDGSVRLAETLVDKVNGNLSTKAHVMHFAPGASAVLGELVYGSGDTEVQTADGHVLTPNGEALVVGSA
jgi:hypothetical protein